MTDPLAGSPDSRAFTKHGTWGSPYDFQEGMKLSGVPFYALLYALIRKADDANTDRIARAWPGFLEEAKARYRAPGGLLEGETR